jgi:hypothetical protein
MMMVLVNTRSLDLIGTWITTQVNSATTIPYVSGLGQLIRDPSLKWSYQKRKKGVGVEGV